MIFYGLLWYGTMDFLMTLNYGFPYGALWPIYGLLPCGFLVVFYGRSCGLLKKNIDPKSFGCDLDKH